MTTVTITVTAADDETCVRLLTHIDLNTDVTGRVTPRLKETYRYSDSRGTAEAFITRHDPVETIELTIAELEALRLKWDLYHPAAAYRGHYPTMYQGRRIIIKEPAT